MSVIRGRVSRTALQEVRADTRTAQESP
jgi:hypothetical protein